MAAHRVARGQEQAIAEIARDLCLAQAQVEIVLAAPADPTSLEAYRGRPKRARRPLRVGERPSPTPEDLAVETLFGKAAVRALVHALAILPPHGQEVPAARCALAGR